MTGTTKRARRGALLGAAVLAILALAGGFASGAAADEGDDTNGKAVVEVTVAGKGAIDALVDQGFDLVEYVREEADGRLTLNIVVDDEERAALGSLGYAIGATIEDGSTYAARIAERKAALAAEDRSHDAAESGDPAKSLLFSANGFNALDALTAQSELTINRVDYFQNYAGWFLSVEVYDRAVNGTGTTGPTVSFSWKTESGAYGAATTIPRFVDTDPSPDVYLYNRILVRIGPAGAAPDAPAMVRVASSTVGVDPVEAPVRSWLSNPLPPGEVNFAQQYFTAYMDPTQIQTRFRDLANEFGGPGGIAQLITLPEKTNGYQRKSMCSMSGTASCTASGTATSAVYLEATKFGQSGGNATRAQFRNPGAANRPLAVSVLPNPAGQADVVVDLATGSTGALTSTAAQVVAAINANPQAAAYLTAYTYGGNAGTGVVAARALVNLTDGLAAPASVERGQFTMQALRISKDAGKSPADSHRTGVYLFCQQHAREWVTPITCVQTAELLLRNYATDPHTRELVDNLDIFILPSVNPDGSHYSLYDFASQRKNLTRYCAITTTNGMPTNRNTWGTDLNRNSESYSLFDGYAGASSSCTSETYAGPSEVSEPETRNLNYIVDTYSNIKFSNNIHTYGGYFMWAPGSYIAAGRISAPAPNFGIEAYFFAAADTVLQRIKDVRGTAVLPARTGPIADVLYSAAGNGADDFWYRKGIIGYSFEAGSDRFSSTSSGTSQSAVGFQPSFSTEGRFEALEFAAGNFGLLESALAYERDSTPPSASMTPAGAASQTPVTATFKWDNEPSVVRYTLDGSTPTLSSPAWERERLRGPGTSFTFTSTTTVKWIAVDVKGNVAAVKSARFAVETEPPVTSAQMSHGGVDDWYSNPVVTLQAEDGVDGSGVALTEYSLDGGPWIRYTAPFTVTGNGDHSLAYHSTDAAGNVEAPKSKAFHVDAVAPEAYLSFDAATDSLGIYGRDPLAGVVGGPFAPTSIVPAKWDSKDDSEVTEEPKNPNAELRTYVIRDRATNQITIVVKVKDTKDDAREVKFHLISVRYGSGATQLVTENKGSLKWSFDKPTTVIDKLEQKLEIKNAEGKTKLEAKYEDKKRETTKVKLKEPGGETKSTEPGLVLIRLVTAAGAIRVEP